MKIVSLAEVKEMLVKLGKERELSREQKISLEHCEKVVKLTSKKAKELRKKLLEVKGVNEKQAYKIADVLPQDDEAVLAIFAKEISTPSEKGRKEILKIVKDYL
jgi:DNA-directed RNA polymerase subunit F